MAPKTSDTGNPSYKAPAISKAFQILAEVAGSPHSIGIVELSERLGFSKSTTHGIVHALIREGALTHEKGSRKVHLDSLLAELVFSNFYPLKVFKQVQVIIDDIRNQINETVFFGVRIRDRVMINAISEVPDSMKISASVGTTLPLLAGAIGKAFLAVETIGRVRQIVEKNGLTRWTKNSIIDRKTYLEELEKVKCLGYAVDLEEYIPGINAVAVTVGNLRGLPAAIWVVGMSNNLDKEKIKKIATVLKDNVQAFWEQFD